ncbi:MAG: ceramidase domain-containing protein [Shimia sp.]
MEWSEQIDIYCERVDVTFWAEPLNAISNGAFIIAALIMAWRLRGSSLTIGWLLVGLLTAIGIGSFLFHTFATQWAALADVLPIGLFILLYLFAVGWRFVDWPWWGAAMLTAAFIPYAAAFLAALEALPDWGLIRFLRISDFYWTVPVLLVLFAPIVGRKDTRTAQSMLIGAAILTVSITTRSLDMPVCEALPIGVHYVWHILNAIMLGSMIEVYRAHMVRKGAVRAEHPPYDQG